MAHMRLTKERNLVKIRIGAIVMAVGIILAAIQPAKADNVVGFLVPNMIDKPTGSTHVGYGIGIQHPFNIGGSYLSAHPFSVGAGVVGVSRCHEVKVKRHEDANACAFEFTAGPSAAIALTENTAVGAYWRVWGNGGKKRLLTFALQFKL